MTRSRHWLSLTRGRLFEQQWTRSSRNLGLGAVLTIVELTRTGGSRRNEPRRRNMRCPVSLANNVSGCLLVSWDQPLLSGAQHCQRQGERDRSTVICCDDFDSGADASSAISHVVKTSPAWRLGGVKAMTVVQHLDK